MNEQDLIDLGFTKEYGYFPKLFYYYALDFGRGFSLITNFNDELIEGKWFAEVYEYSIRFTNKEDLNEFISIINRNRNESNN